MNRFLLGIVALVGLIGALVYLAPMLVPAQKFKDVVEESASAALGRTVSVGDELSFQILPAPAFRVSELTIANADGFDGPPLARVAKADIGVRLLPLLQEKVEISRFILTEPRLHLERKEDGAVNWNIAAAAPTTETTQSPQTEAPKLRDLRLGDVRIVNGAATFKDPASAYQAENINLSIRLDGLNAPLTANGDMIFQGAPSTLQLIITSLGAYLNGEETDIKAQGALGETTFGVDLKVTAKDALSYQGEAALEAPDLTALGALFGVALEQAPGFDNLTFKGAIDGDENALRVTLKEFLFDAIAADGALRLDWSGARPKATGDLTTPALDLRPYLPPPPADAPEGFPAWSQEPMDFSSLRNIDADLDVAAEKIFLNDVKTGEARMKVNIDRGRLVADITQMEIYGGAGSGRMVVNARNDRPSMSGDFSMNNVAAEPFGADFMKIDRLLGIGALEFSFSASGSSQAAIMNSLDGSGKFDLSDGALKGVNIAKFVRAAAELKEGLNPTTLSAALGAAQGADQQTDFSQFLSQFSIVDGLVTAPTISLDGPYLSLNGQGDVNLPAQSVDLRLSPRASRDLDGARGIAVPLRVTGTFSAPKVAIDVEALAKGRVESGLRNVIDALGADETDENGEKKDKDLGGALLRGVLGGGRSKENEQEPQ